MSISRNQETKSTILNLANVRNETLDVARDAMEDREIVGYAITANLTAIPSGSFYAEIHAYIGTDPVPANGESNDNEQWHASGAIGADIDETNGVGWSVDDLPEVWFGQGSGVKWNEDATLTLEATENLDANVTNIYLTVWYRELE